MRKLGAALLFSLWLASAALAQAVGPANTILCNKVGVSAVVGPTTTQLIAGVAGQSIHVCGYAFGAATAGTVQFVFGTGTSCTSPTPFTPIFTAGVATTFEDHSGNAWTSSLPGQSLCMVTAGGTASGAAYASQF